MKKMQKGFTLIELLIVIAIIGILAGVILVSTSGARQKAAITSIKQSMRSISPAGIICRGATPVAGSVQGGNGNSAICSLLQAAGGTDAVLPLITQCGAAAADTVYTITNGGTDNWTLTLTTCTNTPACAGAVGTGLTVNSGGLSLIPAACN